jgi:UDP-N-acetyl-D-galactosamine dehydrogenase
LYSSVGKKIIYTKNVEEAETAKVIENIQRDVNIGLMNEIYLACEKLNLNFENIIKLARTKWNFLKFEPGLVGGHCLPVDPYYFASICKKNKFNTKITLAGRDINDSMVDKIKKKIEVEISKIKSFKLKKILICGLTYKKNVADLRNSLSLEIFKKVKSKYKNIKGFDPLVDSKIAKKNYFSNKIKTLYDYDILIILTKHDLIINEINKVKGKKIISIF